jgi:protein-L-isoaspartate(D-aspartate) O-methyltransferase
MAGGRVQRAQPDGPRHHAAIVAEVYTVERLSGLAEAAAQRLGDLGYRNVHVRCGDGRLGWLEHAPYDVIIVTAGGPRVPPALLGQLAPDGRLVMPVGPDPCIQQLVRVRRRPDGSLLEDTLDAVAFVPLIGAQGWPEPRPEPSETRPSPAG